MHRLERWTIRAALLGAVLLSATESRADIIPEPHRPTHWNDTPAPMPEPPPEKELPAALLVVLVAVAAATVSALRLRGPAAVSG
jgi:hypothetical protein